MVVRPKHVAVTSNKIVTSSLFGLSILLSTLFSNILSLCSSLSVRDQVSHPYKTAGKIIVVYIHIFRFFDNRRKTEGSGLNGRKQRP
jgi:hypothetical protein